MSQDTRVLGRLKGGPCDGEEHELKQAFSEIHMLVWGDSSTIESTTTATYRLVGRYFGSPVADYAYLDPVKFVKPDPLPRWKQAFYRYLRRESK